MKFLHTMLRVQDLDKSLHFFTEVMGLKLLRKNDYPKGEFTLAFLSDGITPAEIELTHNWGSKEEYSGGRNFGHLAFQVENIYEYCSQLQQKGVEILRPPRDGRMAFFKTPDNISIELLQKNNALEPKEPWLSMENSGTW